MSDDAELESRLAALRRGYAVKLRARLERLGELARRARGGDLEALRDAVSEAHKLHGTAGSYGFAEISSCIGELEVRLKDMAAAGAQSPVDWDVVSEGIGAALAEPSLATFDDEA